MSLASLINRCVFGGSKGSTKNQTAAVNGVDSQDKEVEILELFGLTVGNVDGGETVRFSLQGDESHNVALGFTGGAYRPKDAAGGEVILYSKEDNGGTHRIHLKAGKVTELICGSSKIELTPDKFEITIGGNKFTMTASGIETTQDLKAENISVAHHKHTGDSGGNTSEPL